MCHINHLKWQRKQQIVEYRIDRIEKTEKYCIAIECRIRKLKCEHDGPRTLNVYENRSCNVASIAMYSLATVLGGNQQGKQSLQNEKSADSSEIEMRWGRCIDQKAVEIKNWKTRL